LVSIRVGLAPVEGHVEFGGPNYPLDEFAMTDLHRLIPEIHAGAAGGSPDDWHELDAVTADDGHTAVLVGRFAANTAPRGDSADPARTGWHTGSGDSTPAFRYLPFTSPCPQESSDGPAGCGSETRNLQSEQAQRRVIERVAAGCGDQPRG
jgi:hypothetical protein